MFTDENSQICDQADLTAGNNNSLNTMTEDGPLLPVKH